MELIRKNIFWIISVIIIILAVGFQFTVVQKIAAARASRLAELEKRRDELESHSKSPGQIPGKDWIEAAKVAAAKAIKQLDDCAVYLAAQPRDGQTRRFFEEERPGYIGREIVGEHAWRLVYLQQNEALEKQLAEAGMSNFSLTTLSSSWGNKLPTDEQIAAAMLVYWFQKDLVDILTEQVEKDFAAFLKPAPDEPDKWPRKPSDLVINRVLPGKRSLDELLRLPAKEDLVAVLEAIIINEENLDLITIFNKHLPNFAEGEQSSWERVLSLTMDVEQQKFLDNMVPPDQKDLGNRRRFVDFVMDLRSVRYRSDVIGLLENHGLGEVAESIRYLSDQERLRLSEDIKQWRGTRIAQTIAAIVSINDEADYQLVRDNHSLQLANLASISISGLSEKEGGGKSDSEYYRVFPFSLRVKVEFERLPIFIRRMLTNSWHYRFTIKKIEPVSDSERTDTRRAGRGEEAASSEPEGAKEMDVRHYVNIDLEAESYLFSPLRNQLKAAEKPAS